MTLFRKEAVDHQNDTGYGDIIIPASFGLSFSATATIGLIALIFTFLYCGQYTRKAHLSGIVMPSTGLIKITPQYPGHITDLTVSEGQHVAAGAPLYHISGERYNAQGTGTLAAMSLSLKTQYSMLTSQQTLELRDNSQQQQATRQRIGYGASLRGAHTNALVALADNELSQSLSALDGVVSAVKLKRMALSAEQARTTHNGRFSEYEVDIDKSVYAEIRAYLEPRVTKYAFDMASEPELSVIGLSPALSKYMDEALASPAKRHVAFNEIKREESQLKEKGPI